MSADSLIRSVVCVLNVADELGCRDREFAMAFETLVLAIETFGSHEPSLRRALFDVIENGQDEFAESGATLLLLADVASAITEHDRERSSFGL